MVMMSVVRLSVLEFELPIFFESKLEVDKNG